MKGNFAPALGRVLVHEGGYVDHPADPGGATNKGVTQATYNAYRREVGRAPRSVRHITGEEIKAIYRAGYWDEVRADDLPAGVDYAVFDLAVNSGPRRGARFLQRAVGAEDDGAIGPVTLAAAASSPPDRTVRRICQDRLVWLRTLKHWPTFGKGWGRRVAAVERDALADVAEAAKNAPAEPDTDADTYYPPLNQPDDPGVADRPSLDPEPVPDDPGVIERDAAPVQPAPRIGGVPRWLVAFLVVLLLAVVAYLTGA